MAELQPTDEFLVNRNDITYTQETDTLMASLETTDYLLLNRSDSTYKITGEDFINSVIDPLEVTVIIAPNPPLIRENAEAIPVVTGGKKPDGGYVFTYQWHYADDLLGTNKVDIPGQTASTYVVPESDITKFIGCTVTTTDALNTTASGTGYGGPVSAVEIAPVIDEVILTEIFDGENRYTDKQFPYTTVMGLDGTPDPTYAVKAKLSGSTFNFAVESDTITKVEGGGTDVYTTDTISSVGVANAWNQSEEWSTNCVSSRDGGYQIIDSFDGDINTFAGAVAANNGAGAVETLTATVDTEIPCSKLRFRARLNVGATGTIKCNGETININPDDGPSQWYEFPTPPATYTGFVATVNNVTSQPAGIYVQAVEVNGKILVDTGITGDPGAGSILTFPTSNNFDRFEVGDVVQGQTWSDYVTGDALVANNVLGTLDYTFNGDISNGSYAVLGTSLTFTPPTPLSGAVRFVYMSDPAISPSTTAVTIVDTTDTTHTYSLTDIGATAGQPPTYFDCVGVSGIKSISWSRWASSGWIALNAIEVGGTMLVDTPEVSITAIDADAVPPTITVDGGIWLGADGTGDTGDGRYEPSQEWSSVATNPGNSQSSTDSIETGFDGLENTYSRFDGAAFPAANVTIPIAINVGDTVVINAQSDIQVFSVDTGNGTVTFPKSNGPNTIYDISSAFTSNVTSFKFGSAGNWNFSTVSVNGKLLVDSSIPGGMGATDISKTVVYSGKLTVASDKDLDVIQGDIYMTDGTPKQDGSGELEPASYTLLTNEIASIDSIVYSAAGTFASTNSNFQAETYALGFDGDLSSYVVVIPVSTGTITWSYTLPASVSSVTSVRVYGYNGDPSGTPDHAYAINDQTPVTGPNLNNGNSEWHDLTPMLTADGNVVTKITGSLGIPGNTTAPRGIFNAIEINGVVLLDSLTTLTFNSPNPDLQYFKEDDEVQQIGFKYSNGSKYRGIYNNPITTLAETNRGTLTSATEPYYIFNNDVDTIEVPNGHYLGWRFSITGNFDAEITLSNGSTLTKNISSASSSKITRTIFENQTSNTVYITRFEVKNNTNNIGLQNLYVTANEITNDTLWLNEAVPNQVLDSPDYGMVKVISTDLTANTMTVDGGDWAGTDGSGIGTWNQSQVWSDGGDSNVKSAEDWQNSFDGTTVPPHTVANSGATARITFPANTTFSKIELSYWCQGNQSQFFNVNGDDVTSLRPTANSSGVFVDVTSLVTGNTLSYIEFNNGDNNNPNVFSGVKLDGVLLVDSGTSGAPTGETQVTVGPFTAEGTIASVDGTEVDLSASSGRWIANNKAGIPFSFVPATPNVSTADQVWGNLQIINDKAQVIGIQRDDPGFLNVTNKDYSVQFPSVFATGQEPDDDLPLGTSISVIVKAENGAGASVKESNTLLPQVPNPDGAAGPITDVEGGGTEVFTTDTIASVSSTSNTGITATVSGWGSPGNAINTADPTNTRSTSTNSAAGKITFDTPIQGVTKVEAYTRFNGNGRAGLEKADGNDIQVDIVGTGTKWYTVYDDIDNPIDLKEYYQQTDSGASDDFWALRINDVVVGNDSQTSGNATGSVNPIGVSGLTLTFPTDNNFDKFEVGEVVQTTTQVGAEISVAHPLKMYLKRPNGTVANSRIYGLKINGQELIEVGDEYSRYCTHSEGNSFREGEEPDKGFDGDPTTLCNGPDGMVIFAPEPPITNVKTIETFYQSQLTGYKIGFEFDGYEGESEPFDETNSWYPVSFAGDVQHKIISKNENANTMTIDGGSWLGADNSGDPAGDTDISKSVSYDSKLTVGQPANLDGFIADDALVMVDDTGAVASYTPVTSEITSVSTDANPVLTFESPNPDLQYFEVGDVVQREPSSGIRTDIVSEDSNYVTDISGFTVTGSNQYYVLDGFFGPGKKIYYEITIKDMYAANTDAGTAGMIGLVNSNTGYNRNNSYPTTIGNAGLKLYRDGSGGVYESSTQANNQVQTYTNWNINDVIGIAWDTGLKQVSFYKNDIKIGNTVTYTADLNEIRGQVNGTPSDKSSAFINIGQVNFVYDDKGFTDRATGHTPFSITDIDTTANTMTIDGGEWLGSDGSGDAGGDTEVTGPAKSGTGTFVSTNGIDTVNIENTNNEWISNDNRLSENFYIKKIFTALNANDPAHVALQQAVSAAFTAFPQKVNARRTSIASSLYRLMAGQTLSAEESAVLTATVRTAVNAVEPFALDGYYPLYYTAAAANAASSVGDHHTHDMNGETFYMPDGGTLYHGNYVAPEEEAVAETPAPTPTPTPTPDPTPDPGSGY